MRRKPDEGIVCIEAKPGNTFSCPQCVYVALQIDRSHSKARGCNESGYSRFRCRGCGRRFNERTGTPFNYLEFPSDIVFQVVVFRLLFKFSPRDLVLMRGYQFTHETVRE